MSIKDKIKSAIRKTKTAAEKHLRRGAKSELAAEEVIEKEVFPRDTKNNGSCKKKARTANSAQKPASKRSRPTNTDYQMIDPDDNTCDTSQS
ncbi:MAG: hypothetical protein OSJ83_01525 [Clostridia bacterium]|nr:hypothetical protein [Clostridia bacterium]